jgi:uncharacterized membrane protein
MRYFILHHLPKILLYVFFILYFGYFSVFSILRLQSLNSHYFDLGIMHQATFNSFKSIKDLDLTRFLEITDPHESLMQVKRMAIHNDIILGFLSIFYFIHSGPETLLVMQSFIVALGGFFVYKIARIVFSGAYSKWIALSFSTAYFLYPPLQKALNFDFHAVTLSVTFLLGMYYFYLKKNYIWQTVFAVLTLTTKEQIGFVIVGFCTYQIVLHFINNGKKGFKAVQSLIYPLVLGIISFIWVVSSVLMVIPYFRGGEHFGADYYTHLFANPLNILTYTFSTESFRYMYLLLAPVGFLAIFAPQFLFIASSEFGANILSANPNMRNIFFHYDTGVTAFVFLGSMYGANFIINLIKKQKLKFKPFFVSVEKLIIIYVICMASVFSFLYSPLPWSMQKDIVPFKGQSEIMNELLIWNQMLGDDVKVSSTGKISAYLASRRYFYDFAGGYGESSYIFIYENDLSNSFQRQEVAKEYGRLNVDRNYILIEDMDGLKIYKRIGRI